MKSVPKPFYVLMVLAMLFGMLGMQPVKPVQAGSQALRISQAYGGGDSGATYKNDFIELFNSSNIDVDLTGWSVQHASSTGSTWQVTPLTGTIPANSYYLIQEAAGAGGTVNLPTPDATGSINMGGNSFKVALVNSTTALSGTCPTGVIDFVGAATVANCSEGAGPAPTPSNLNAVIRKEGGCQDTDDNAADFVALAPAPRNTASPTNVCTPATFPERFIISEYIEGSSSNKAIELYNGTGADINLQDFKIVLYTNGSTTPGNTLTWATETILADGETYVIANSSANAAILALADVTSTITFYNGDDALVLFEITAEGDVVQDSFGQRGNDPGTFWGTGDTSTLDHTLVRKETVCQGDILPDDAFVPSVEYNGFAIDTISDLGSHTMTCGPAVEVPPTVTSTVPTNNGTAQKTDNIVITFSEAVTVADGWYSISCGTSGAHTAVVTDADPVFTLNPDPDFTIGETCTVTIDHTKVNDDDNDDATADYMLADYVFSFSIEGGCGDPFTPIYTIQGTGETSPLADTNLSTEGVVVGDFQVGGKNGYYIQDPTGDGDTATSDGIFVYNTTTAVNVGDHVRVSGKAVEFSGITEISPVTQVLICSTGNTVTPTTVTLPVTAVSDFEKYESMLVTFPQSLIISEYFNFDRYGEIVLTSTRHMTPTAVEEPGTPEQAAAALAYTLDRITLDDGLGSAFQNPDPAIHPNGQEFTMGNLFRGGGTVTGVTGVMDYDFNLYRIQPTQGAVYVDANPRTAAPEITEADLKVTSFNVLNYFVTLDDGVNDICGSSGTLECRGADDAEEFGRQKAKILAALDIIDSDIYGLMEIENDSPISQNDAVADLVAGLNAIKGAGTYAFIVTGAIGGDAIKQAILYKPAAVTPVGGYQILDSSVDGRFIDTANRPVLAQVFVDNEGGLPFVVAVNHLKSKGSACVGDPDLFDGAGNCNLTRKEAAKALVDWLANPVYFPDVEKALIIGDLNSYDKEDPIDMIKLGADDTAATADDYLDMVFEIRGDLAYGYVFDGQTGYLDHALASQALAENIVDVNFWHVNADEPDLIDYDTSFKKDAQDALYAPDAYRSSDHDPVLVTLDVLTLEEQITAAVDYVYDPVYEYTGLIGFDDLNNVFTASYTVPQFGAGGPMNDLARYLGALYRQHDSSVSSILFNSVTYTWNPAGTLKGSNWEDASGNTLVSAMVAYYLATPGDLLVTVSDPTLTSNITFRIVLLDTLDAEIASAPSYVYDPAYIPVGSYAFEDATNIYTMTYDDVEFNPGAMNDLARYLGALYRQTGATVTSIVYGGVTYTWNTAGTLLGSNWEDAEGNTLVSVVVAGIGSYDPAVGLIFTLSDGIHTETVTFKYIILDTIAPVMEEVLPAEGLVTLGLDDTFILTVDAFDLNLYELEIDHSFEGTLPEFSVYASEETPWGTAADKDMFDAAGVTISYDADLQKWTIDFGEAITDAYFIPNGVTFYMVLLDEAGNKWGSMDPTTAENTFAYTFDVTNTLEAEITSAVTYEYTPPFAYTGDINFDDINNIFTGTYSPAEFLANGAVNDLARYLGALYRQSTSTVASIVFNGVTYTWDTTGTLLGSNWEDTSGNTLVSAMAAYYFSAAYDPADGMQVTLHDGWHTANVTFKIIITDTLDAEIASAPSYVYDPAYIPVGSYAFEDATNIYTMTYDDVEFNPGAMNDLARYLGALYRQTGATVTSIVYGGVTYTWNTAGTLLGSNWEDAEGNTLVSVVVAGIGSYDPAVGLIFTLSDGIHTETVTFKYIILDTIAPVMEEVLPAEGLVTLGLDDTFILTVDAFDLNLYELEIDHSFEGTLPEFSVYASEETPWGTAADKDMFDAAGVTISYDADLQKWTIDFGEAITDAYFIPNGVTFYMVLLDEAGNKWGSMDPTTAENTFAYTFDVTNTLEAEITSAVTYEYTPPFAYTGDINFDDINNIFTGTYSPAEFLANGAVNDLARYLGALYRQSTSTVASIVFNGVTYTWDTTGTLLGSNWEDTSGNTLVSAMAAYYFSAAYDPADGMQVTLHDGWHTANVTFKIIITDTLDAEIASAPSYVYDPAYIPVGSYAFEDATNIYTMTYDDVEFNPGAMNDLARYLGALYRQTGATVTSIVYGGVTYTWNTAGTLLGSNWEDAEGNTLVSVVVAGIGSYDPAVGLVFTLSDGIHTETVTFKYIILDTIAPVLTITGATADGVAMPGTLEDGYELLTTNDSNVNHSLQIIATSSEPLEDTYFGLYLTDATAEQIAALEAYYETKSEPYKTYLLDALDGTNPFVYFDGGSLTLVDAAQHDLPPYHDIPMVVPDDFPEGTYTVQGVVKDAAGNETPVTLKLIILRPFVVTEVDLEASTVIAGPYAALPGSLAGGFTMVLDPTVAWYYFDTDTITSNRPLADGSYPFYLEGTSTEVFTLVVNGTDYFLRDTYANDGTPLRVQGNFPLGAYTYVGDVADAFGFTDEVSLTITFVAPLAVTEVDLEASTVIAGPYTALPGSLAGGFTMALDPAVAWYYFDTDTITSNRPLADGSYPFYLEGTTTEVFTLVVSGTDYFLRDTYANDGTPLRVQGNFPLGAYTYVGDVADAFGFTDEVSLTITFVAPLAVTEVELAQSTDLSIWTPVDGNLADGYAMNLDTTIAFYYLDAESVTSNRTLADGSYPFFMTANPGTEFFAYWAGRGVVDGATGWQALMWPIINGDAPMFYLKVEGASFTLIDGLQGDPNPLRVNGDYYPGLYGFTGIVEDLFGYEDELDVLILFNDIPVAEDQSVTVVEDTATAITLSAMDIYTETMTYTVVTPPAHGALTGTAPALTYTPALNYVGPDSFTFTVNDGLAESVAATVTITVTPVPDDPIAVDDEYDVDEDDVLTVAAPGVMANDIEVDTDNMVVVLLTNVTNGTLVLLGDGSFTYTPDPDFNGTDSFEYRLVTYPGIQDAWTDDALVTITVHPINDAPVAEDQDVTTAEDTAKDITLMATDIDDGDTLTFSIVDDPINGSVTLAGSVATYTPDPDFNGEDSFTFTANDGTVDSDMAVVTITVTPVNDAPVAEGDGVMLDEDTTLTISAPGVLLNDTDVDGDELTAILVSDVSFGTLALADDGSFVYTPDENYFGDDSFTYKASDGTLESNTVTVTITINPVNDWVVANDDEYETMAGVTLEVAAPGVLTNDELLDPNETVNLSIVSHPSGGSLTLNTDGSFTYVPNAGFFGVDTFVYQLNSTMVLQGEFSDTATVTITVTARQIFLPLILR